MRVLANALNTLCWHAQKEFERGNKLCDTIMSAAGPVDWAPLVEPADEAFFTGHKNYLQVPIPCVASAAA